MLARSIRLPRALAGVMCAVLAAACGSDHDGGGGSSAGGGSASGGSAGMSGGFASTGTGAMAATGGSDPSGGASGASDGGDPDASDAGADTGVEGGSGPCAGDTLTANRNRLLESYYQFLVSSVVTPQTNGLSGSNVSSALEVWQKLDPSSRAVFLTLTARMQSSLLGQDGSSMLSHVTKIYRVVGGDGATSTDVGSCGGGEYNRMIMSMDATLHDAQVAANAHHGAVQSNGKRDISDAVSSSFWRNSNDLAGPHEPFDLSDETEGGAPRGQTQFFADPTSKVASAPLGRQDLETLIDPYALELDHDYDCIHSSNPLCTYFAYGPLCLPQAPRLGTELYADTYGDYDASWTPASCK
jgi:hypothetical protein